MWVTCSKRFINSEIVTLRLVLCHCCRVGLLGGAVGLTYNQMMCQHWPLLGCG
uniref:Uncharacterized protein n=1 Tax=virus sp. ct6zJ3 TaxID=2826792 RepID=A0A8S5R8A5_9VIRU|nr:MAG TPA: hypothetical protein [virus sp. ct6zJ3]